jgi:hypothetical protein
MTATIYQPGFARTQQRNRWWHDTDGAWATTATDITETVPVRWSLDAALDSGVTVDSVTYEDSGLASSGSAISGGAVVTFTLVGLGDTKVTATLSDGNIIVQRFRVYPVNCSPRRGYDYGNR